MDVTLIEVILENSINGNHSDVADMIDDYGVSSFFQDFFWYINQVNDQIPYEQYAKITMMYFAKRYYDGS